MRRFLLLLLCSTISVAGVGCARSKPAVKPSVKEDVLTPVSPLPPYAGSKARVAVADFEVKAIKAPNVISAGIREMLVAALTNSKRFSVKEPESLNALAQEQSLSLPPGKDEKAQEALPENRQADLIITGAVSEFEPQASGGTGGVGGGGGANSGAFGGLLGITQNQAHLALDVRIVNAATTEVIASTRVQGQAFDVEGSIVSGNPEAWKLGSGLSLYANTPMEEAIRVCVIEAVRYIALNIPAQFYKY